jgi:HEPN domain-containing protein
MIEYITTKEFLKEANDYYKLSVGGMKRKNIFTNEILYNTISMALEKYIMALFVSKNELPECHTLKTMAKDMRKFVELDDDLIEQLYYYDNMQNLCSLANYDKKSITDEDITNMISVLEKIKALVLENLKETEENALV